MTDDSAAATTAGSPILVRLPRSGCGSRPPSGRTRPPLPLLVVAAGIAATLTACAGPPTPVTPATPVAAETPAALPPQPSIPATPDGGFGGARVALGPVVWATSLDEVRGGPTQTVTAIPDDAPRFWAATPLLRAEPGVRIRAEWSYNGTPMPALTAEAVVGDAAAAWAAFDLRLPTGERWPIGDYGVTISVDGQPALSASVPVVAAPG